MPSEDCINQRISKMEGKLETHHTTLEHHDRRLSDMSSALHENTKLTKQIADNTGEMVDLFKEAKVIVKWGVVFKKFIIWATSVTISVAGVFAAVEMWMKK